jgi:hypothetical protein
MLSHNTNTNFYWREKAVKIDFLNLYKSTKTFTLPVLAIGYTLLVIVPEAGGTEGYKQCHQILTQDISNKNGKKIDVGECVAKTKETNIYAFASRDRAGKKYKNLTWVPGTLERKAMIISSAIELIFILGIVPIICLIIVCFSSSKRYLHHHQRHKSSDVRVVIKK